MLPVVDLPPQQPVVTLEQVIDQGSPLSSTAPMAIGKPDQQTDSPNGGTDLSQLRINAVREAGYTYAMQTAIAQGQQRINGVLAEHQWNLDRIFAFDRVVESIPASRGVLLRPPVITEANQGLRSDTPNQATTALTTYRIERDADLVGAAPSWRDYLIHRYVVNDIHPAVLPRDQAEFAIWKGSVARGWRAGESQSLRLFQVGLSRLERDFVGMLRFRVLQRQGLVSLPDIAQGDLSIHIDGKALELGRRDFRIVDPSKWTSPEGWRALPYSGEGRGR